MTEQWELYRDNAQLSLLRRLHRAEERIARGVHMEKNAAALRLNIDVARDAFGRLSVCVAALAEERPSLAFEAWHAAHALFEATYALGGLSEISESAADAVVRHGKRELGKVRGKQQTAKADKWREPALDYARVLRKEQPSISQAAIAEKIRAEIVDFEVPQPAQVLETVRKWERDRKLDRSQKKSRVS
jgi:hypothetical protein